MCINQEKLRSRSLCQIDTPTCHATHATYHNLRDDTGMTLACGSPTLGRRSHDTGTAFELLTRRDGLTFYTHIMEE